MAKRIGTVSGHPPNATLPPPPFRLVQDHPGKKRNCVKFFEYWKELAGTVPDPKDAAQLVEVRFYLHSPVVEPKLVDPLAKTRFLHLVTGAIWFENPEDYVVEVSRKFGSGKWYTCLNEVNVHVCLMAARFESEMDWDTYPPQIDLRMLVRNSDENQDYMRWLAKTGAKTPWGHPDLDEDGEDDMASEATKTLADAVTSMAETAVRAVQEGSDAKLDALQEQLDGNSKSRSPMVDASAAAESIKLVSATADAANKAAFGFADKMVDMVTKNSGSQFNPIEVMRAAHEMMGPKDDGSIKLLVEAMKDDRKQLVEMQTKQFDFMQTVLKDRNQPVGDGGTVLGGLDGMLDQAEKVKRAAELFGWSRGGSEPTAPAAPLSKPLMESISENIVPVCTMITTVLTIGANIFYNMRLKPGEAAQNPAEALVKAQANNPAIQYQQQQQAAPPQDPRLAWKKFINDISKKMETHFYGGDGGLLNGYTFAEWILSDDSDLGTTTPEGRKAYVRLRDQLGRVAFDQLVREHERLWPMFQGMQVKYNSFLDEFFGYDEWQLEQQKLEQGVAA